MSSVELTLQFKQTLKQSIVVAFERTGTTPLNAEQIDSMAEDVLSEFPDITDSEIKKALRNGGLGKYGKTYKLTTQELCIWIRQYLDDNTFKAPWQ